MARKGLFAALLVILLLAGLFTSQSSGGPSADGPSLEARGALPFHAADGGRTGTLAPAAQPNSITIPNATLGASAYNPGNGLLYVLDGANSTAALVSPSGQVTFISTGGSGPSAIVFDPVDNYTYISNSYSDSVAVLGVYGILAVLHVGTHPVSMAVDTSSGEVYVLNGGSDNISVIGGLSVTSTISLGAQAPPAGYASAVMQNAHTTSSYITYDSANGCIYAVDIFRYVTDVVKGSAVVAVVSTGSAGGYWTTGTGSYLPVSVVADPMNGYVYETNPMAGNLTVVGNSGIIATLHTADYLNGLAYDPALGHVLLLQANGSIGVVDGLRISGNLSAGLEPVSGTFDTAAGRFYIVNRGSSNITLLAPASLNTYAVTISESGLPAGTLWSAGVDGLTEAANSTSFSFALANGTYSYSIQEVQAAGGEAYLPGSFSGSLAIAGAPVFLNVTFSLHPAYNHTFRESGLPSGTSWWINTSTGISRESQGSALNITVPGGLYTYEAQTGSRSWYAPAGSFDVTGGQNETNVTFTLFENTLDVSIWDYNVSQSPYPSSIPLPVYLNFSDGQSYEAVWNASSPPAFLQVMLPNGTYGYSLSALSGRISGILSGITYVNEAFASVFSLPGGASSIASYEPPGSHITATGLLSQTLVHALFTEHGLPAGSAWNLTIQGSFAGIRYNSSVGYGFGEPVSTQYGVYLFNGTYSFMARSQDRHFHAVYATFTVNTAAGQSPGSVSTLNFSVTFTPVLYPLSVSESGLPSGYSWSLRLGNTTYTSTGQSITLSLPYGDYQYSFNNSSLYYPQTPSGSIAVDGPAVISVSYYEFAQIIGIIGQPAIPSSLPLTYDVAVTVNGAAIQYSGGYFNLYVTAGYYNVTFSAPSGVEHFNLTLGPGQTAVLTYHPARGAPYPHAWGLLLPALLAAAAAVEAVLIAALVRKGRVRL